MNIFSRFNPPPKSGHDFPLIRSIRSYDPINKNTVVVGEQNIKAFISAPAEECSIYRKIQRYVAGDIYALGNGNQKGVYTDVSGMPTDINSIHKMCRDVNAKIRAFGVDDVPSFLDILNKSAGSDSSDQNSSSESEASSDAE